MTHSKKILIVGATSGIAHAVCKAFLSGKPQETFEMLVLGRNSERLAQVAADLTVRGAKVHVLAGDLTSCTFIQEAVAHVNTLWNALDVALIAHGSLTNQSRAEHDLTYAQEELLINGWSAMAWSSALAQAFIRQKSGVIAAISSVAGDRGRPSNHFYGAAKAALNTHLEGLRALCAKQGVHVLTIKPGFVATAMTADLALPAALTASPERVAVDIVRAINRRQDVLYTPWFWWGIMIIIKSIPSFVFKKLSL